MPALRDELRRFIVDTFLFYDQSGDELDDDASFLENRVLDSTGVLELVAFLERTYGIKVADDELDPDNLDSLNRLVAFVERKKIHA